MIVNKIYYIYLVKTLRINIIRQIVRTNVDKYDSQGKKT
jgi:hypothetical protein